MIILLYGKDTYRSRRKLEEIIKEYGNKYQSGLNLKFLNEEEAFSDLLDCNKQVSMFSEKKMVVVQNPFSKEKMKNDFLKNRKKVIMSENIIVLYQEGEIKKQEAFFKQLLKEKEGVMIQEFQPLTKAKFLSWIKEEFEKNGAAIEEEAVWHLGEIGRDNLWRIKNEIDKLSLYKKEIKKEDVDYMVHIGVDAGIFQTIDAIAEKNKEKSLLSFYSHLEKKDNPFYIFSMIIYQFRNLICVKELKERRYSYEKVMSKSGLHTFVFRKTYKQAEKFSLSELKKIYEELFKIDLKAKTGQIDPELALQLFIFKN